MKSSIRRLIPLLALALSVAPALRAQESEPKVEKKERKELRVLVGKGDRAPRELEPVTFLGIETSRVSPTLTEQLGLAKGIGLVITSVVPDSPASAVLKPHDILTKLNDQLLVDSHQLGVLVRSFKEGDEVKLTYVRAGKEATATVKLAKRDLPKMTKSFELAPFDHFGREEVDRLLSTIDDEHGTPHAGKLRRLREIRPMTSKTLTSESTIIHSEGGRRIELKLKEGKKTLTAKNEKGDVVFSGPINTDEERAKLPTEVRAQLDEIETTAFSFKTDGDFESGDVKIAVPGPKRISLPLPANAPLPGHPPVPAAMRTL